MFFTTGDGTTLHGRMAGCGRDLVIWSPGAGGNTVGAEKWCEPLEDKYGYSTFAYDLRGQGKSNGLLFDFENQIQDIEYAIDAAIHKMEERDKGPDRVILIGHSLGAVAALTIGIQDPRVNIVFALSTLYSIEDFMVADMKEQKNRSLVSIGKKMLKTFKASLSPPWWFKQFINFVSGGKTLFMPKYYLTEELIKKAYIIHGTKDEYIPFEKSGKLIIDKYKLSKERYFLIDAGHGFENHEEKVLKWIVSKL